MVETLRPESCAQVTKEKEEEEEGGGRPSRKLRGGVASSGARKRIFFLLHAISFFSNKKKRCRGILLGSSSSAYWNCWHWGHKEKKRKKKKKNNRKRKWLSCDARPPARLARRFGSERESSSLWFPFPTNAAMYIWRESDWQKQQEEDDDDDDDEGSAADGLRPLRPLAVVIPSTNRPMLNSEQLNTRSFARSLARSRVRCEYYLWKGMDGALGLLFRITAKWWQPNERTNERRGLY